MLGKINKLQKRTAQRRGKLPEEFIQTQQTSNGAKTDGIVADARVPDGAILGGRRRLFLADGQTRVPLGAMTLYPVPCAGHFAGDVAVHRSEVGRLHQLARAGDQVPHAGAGISEAIKGRY